MATYQVINLKCSHTPDRFSQTKVDGALLRLQVVELRNGNACLKGTITNMMSAAERVYMSRH